MMMKKSFIELAKIDLSSAEQDGSHDTLSTKGLRHSSKHYG